MPMWSKALSKPGQEFSRTVLPLLQGQIPTRLRGTLYRNGPARLSRGGQRVGHWFDGDGAILGVYFTDEGVHALYRYVQTQGYRAETQSESFLFPNYGMSAPGAFWNSWGKDPKNTANTSVLIASDRILALWEGGMPHALNLDTLETYGIDDLGGLGGNQPFSAHPKIDSVTGEIFNFGITPGPKSTLNLYKCDRRGRIKQKNGFPLEGLPLVHDFALAGDYLVFFISPVRVNLLQALFGFKSFSDAMEWQPGSGTQILVFDRTDLSLVSRTLTDSWYQWHFTNGFVDGFGNINICFVRYEDFRSNQYLKEVAGGETKTNAPGRLWELVLDPIKGKIIRNERLHDRACEFPVVSGDSVGQPWRYTYLAIHEETDTHVQPELLVNLACFDHEKRILSIGSVEKNCYPSEPILVPGEEGGWILTVVYNGNCDRSEVRIYPADNIGADPICTLALPEVIAPGFHGTWRGS
ncbi:MAG: Apocarotenoid-15,15'-oxygenase [Chroococcopsis gigantea SAG 12.99]|jgi:all-trans-8'-apo-beta-carotenal 15,15'-oxygenase|nr:carotenoid oxygenase family protein [Chlorogloea purpurea SAG 13.99]MDV3001734.1 Apocarotenoid-15,15'-oxygenase [Chroococcopsis gigantea SAG 12.99]